MSDCSADECGWEPYPPDQYVVVLSSFTSAELDLLERSHILPAKASEDLRNITVQETRRHSGGSGS